MQKTASPSGLAGFNFEDLSRQAQQRLIDCREEVARQLADAETEAKRIREQAQQAGLAAGRAQAEQEAEQKLQHAILERMGQHSQAVRVMVTQLADQHQAWMVQYSESLTSLAIEIAERIVRAKLPGDHTILVRWAEDAVMASRSAQRLTVAVHPETLAEVGAALDELLRTPGLPDDTILVPDESVELAGVVVRQLGGDVDASLIAQLQTLRELLEAGS